MHPNPTSRQVSDGILPPFSLTPLPPPQAARDFSKLQVRTCSLDKASVAPQCVWDRVQTPPLMSKQEHSCLPLWRLRPPIYFQPLCLSPIRFFPIPNLTVHSLSHWSCSLCSLLFQLVPVLSSKNQFQCHLFQDTPLWCITRVRTCTRAHIHISCYIGTTRHACRTEAYL